MFVRFVVIFILQKRMVVDLILVPFFVECLLLKNINNLKNYLIMKKKNGQQVLANDGRWAVFETN